jgi:hypothetical protein
LLSTIQVQRHHNFSTIMRFQSRQFLANVPTYKLVSKQIGHRADWKRNQPFLWSMEVKDG